VCVTEPHPDYIPKDGSPVPVIAHTLGWLELPVKGTGLMMHNALAASNPGVRVVTMGTEGVNIDDDPILHGEPRPHPFETTSVSRLEIIRHFAEQEAPTTLFGISMGAVSALHIAALNLRAADRHKIDDIVLLTPGVVADSVPAAEAFRPPLDTTRERYAFVGKFIVHAVTDAVREGILHPTHAIEALAGVTALATSMLRHHDVRSAVSNNLVELMKGTSWELINEVVAQLPTSIANGGRDTIGEHKMWAELAKRYPHVSVDTQPNGGHLMILNTNRLAFDTTHRTPAA
jgi:pimeloyl-ACP methyl ester carboxylesterase